MNDTEYMVIEEPSVTRFVEQLNEAAENGFTVISSNHFIIKHDSYGHPDPFEMSYYALLVRNPIQASNDFHYKILEELNEIKFELIEVVKNLKYLRE